MLDDLRNSSSFIDDEPPAEQEPVQRRPARRRQKETFLGMTAQQRFIISLMLFLMICVMGTFALVISGSITLPF
ncbi:MAG: hypothetical protein IH586_14880 [Anaerolineaceae bacterium]|nr:hypothetical protein [Anaerolineaceae bacterium]